MRSKDLSAGSYAAFARAGIPRAYARDAQGKAHDHVGNRA